MSCDVKFAATEADELPSHGNNNRKGPHQSELARQIEDTILDWHANGSKRYLVLRAESENDTRRLYQTVSNVINSRTFKRTVCNVLFRCTKRRQEVYVYKEERGRRYVP